MRAESTGRESTVGGAPSWNPFEALVKGIQVARSQPIVVGLFVTLGAIYGLEKVISDGPIENLFLAGSWLVGTVLIATAVLGITHRYAAVARYGGPTGLEPHLRALVWLIPMFLSLNILIIIGMTLIVAVPYVFASITGQHVFQLVGVPIAIYCLLRISLAYPAVTIGRQNPVQALVYSWRSAKGQLGRLFVLVMAASAIRAVEELNGFQFGTNVTHAAFIGAIGIAYGFVYLAFAHAYLETADPPRWTDSGEPARTDRR
ncbi:hypothetical protein [Halomicrococcus gelatinilyticus]|uniref:hypothetical protein n=1 Tax=Halomicrococcus gelatinilyticus TaxID=1702103 RepID=UPI002E0E2B11